MTDAKQNERYADLLHKKWNGPGDLTPGEKRELRALERGTPTRHCKSCGVTRAYSGDAAVCLKCGTPWPKPKRIAWGEPGSKVVRKTNATAWSHGQRTISVMVKPDGTIGLKAHKERTWYYVPAAWLFKVACARATRVEIAKRKAARKGKR